MIFLSLLLVGACAGMLGAIMGLGGGIFLVPLLTLLFDLPLRIAVGTSLMAVIATSAGVAALAPRGRGADVSLALRLVLASAAGGICGGMLSELFSPSALHILFACMAFFSAGFTLYKTHRRPRLPSHAALFHASYQPGSWLLGISASAIAGMVSGLLGVGGGFIQVPIMYALMDIPLRIATATSNFMIGITAAASAFVYYERGDIHPLVVIPTALGVFGGAMLGAFFLRRMRTAWIRTALVVLLLLIGARMLWEGLR